MNWSLTKAGDLRSTPAPVFPPSWEDLYVCVCVCVCAVLLDVWPYQHAHAYTGHDSIATFSSSPLQIAFLLRLPLAAAAAAKVLP